MTGWGQDGPLAREPGHDINYIALAGALGAIGPADGDPAVPLNLVGDMGGGGLLLALGICAALLHAQTTGEGQVVDAAMTDGIAIELAVILGLRAHGNWSDRRGSNLLDGGAPFYRTYRCADDKHMAVGSLEPQFYAELLRVLELTEDALFADQYDQAAWPAMSARLEERFAARPARRMGGRLRRPGCVCQPGPQPRRGRDAPAQRRTPYLHRRGRRHDSTTPGAEVPRNAGGSAELGTDRRGGHGRCPRGGGARSRGDRRAARAGHRRLNDRDGYAGTAVRTMLSG